MGARVHEAGTGRGDHRKGPLRPDGSDLSSQVSREGLAVTQGGCTGRGVVPPGGPTPSQGSPAPSQVTKVNSDATPTAGPWTGWDEDTSLQIHHPSATMRKKHQTSRQRHPTNT